MTDRLYIGIGGHIVAIQASTGEEIWRTKLRRSSFVTVCVRPGAVFGGAAGHLYCLDPGTGAIRWHNGLDGLGTSLVSFGDPIAAAAAIAAQQAAAAASTGAAAGAT
jgi:outer membrane protein assembly factor BamB